MFTWLDGILLGAAQRFCDRAQQLTGLTKFRFQKWAAVISMMFYVLDTIVYSSRHDIDAIRFYAIGMLIFLLSMSGFVLMTEIEEKEFLTKGKPMLSIFHDAGTRLLTTGFYSGMGVAAFFCKDGADNLACSTMCCVMFVYFSACIPRPPSKSTVRKWYEKMLTMLNESLKPEPVFIPIPS